jgi:hypothetical protein
LLLSILFYSDIYDKIIQNGKKLLDHLLVPVRAKPPKVEAISQEEAAAWPSQEGSQYNRRYVNVVSGMG